MCQPDTELTKLAKMLTKIGDHLVEKHSAALGKLKSRRKRRYRISVSDDIREVSGKLAEIGDKLQRTTEARTKGFSLTRTLLPARRVFKDMVVGVIRRLSTKD